jgi:hypothetical protein
LQPTRAGAAGQRQRRPDALTANPINRYDTRPVAALGEGDVKLWLRREIERCREAVATRVDTAKTSRLFSTRRARSRT